MDDYETASSNLKDSTKKAQSISGDLELKQNDTREGKSWFSKIGSMRRDLINLLQSATQNIIDLIVVFVLQTIILPLFVLWVLIKIAGNLLRKDFSGVIQKGYSELVPVQKL